VSVPIDSVSAQRRLLLVHAHPDDETIGTGATMAAYVAAGAQVTLVTCTLGEEGEILVPELSQLEAGQADQLGGWRIGELARAMAELGVTDHRFLGGAGRFRDSGMMGSAANEKPRAFWRANSDRVVFYEAVLALVEIIREVRPQVVLTYDDVGGYGHPDHIMAHRVTMAAVAASASVAGSTGFVRSGGAPWEVSKLYWTAMPRTVLAAGLQLLEQSPDAPFTAPDSSVEPAPVIEDHLVTTCIDAADFVKMKEAALAQHATQVTVHGSFYALSNNLGQLTSGVEYFRLIQGEPGGPLDEYGRESDLFGGIDLTERASS
jgi:N-acetyl-1-D-myo-inositol-2-amino-2-deoxy-alpha-D-glucopyranoside deacetylase